MAQLFDHEGLEVCGGEVVADLDAALDHFVEEGVSLILRKSIGQADYEHEPAHLAALGFGWDDDAVVAGEDLSVHGCDVSAFFDEFVESGELGDAEGTVDVAEAVIVA